MAARWMIYITRFTRRIILRVIVPDKAPIRSREFPGASAVFSRLRVSTNSVRESGENHTKSTREVRRIQKFKISDPFRAKDGRF